MSWVSRNQDLINAIRSYILQYESYVPPFFSLFNESGHSKTIFLPGSEEGLRLLLMYSALHQDISEEMLCSFLREMHFSLGEDLFRLNRLDSAVLLTAVQENLPVGWALSEKVPGIMRSVCDFLQIHGNLSDMLESGINSEEIVDMLCIEIFYMGKTSVMKPKARLFIRRILDVAPHLAAGLWTPESILPVSTGASRFMHFIGPLRGQRRREFSAQEKLEYHNRFYRLLYPVCSWKVYYPLELFKMRSGNDEKCWSSGAGSCSCALKSFCFCREVRP